MIIIGARGHGKMIATLEQSWGYLGSRIIGFLDRDPALHGITVLGIPVLGGHELIHDYRGQGVALGIGTNDERKRLYEELTEAGFRIQDFRHPSAVVSVDAVIGRNVILNTGCIVEHDSRVGDHAHICPGAVLCGGVEVGEGAVIGAGATVRDGVRIGAWATVGAGAVVLQDVPSGLTVTGNPAAPLIPYDFQQDGFCILRNFFDPRPVEAALIDFLCDEASGLQGRSINYAEGGVVNSLHALSSAFFDGWIRSTPMLTCASALLGEPAVPRAVECFAKPPKVGLPSPWHQDNAYWCAVPPVGVTLWLALDRADEENGGVSYLRGSHKLGLLPHYPSGAPGSSQTIGDLRWTVWEQKVTPRLRPGDALAHHCLTIHGSAENRSDRSRRGITLQYVGQSVRYDQEKIAAYEAMLAKQIAGRA